MAWQTPVGARSNRRRETVLLGKNAAGWLLEGAGDSAPRGMIVQIERSDRTRLTGQRASDNFALSGILHFLVNMRIALTPSQRRLSIRRLNVAFLAVAHIVLGCATPQPTPSSLGTLSPMPRDSTASSIFPRFIVREETAIYDVQSITHTDEITPLPGTRDSTVFAEITRVTIRRLDRGFYRLVLSSESLGKPAEASMAAIRRVPMVMEALVDSTTGTFTVAPVLPSTACETISTLLSPLLLRALLRNTLTEAASQSTVSSFSFSYTTCRGGVDIRHTVVWPRATGYTDRASDNIDGAFSGHLAADSSRVFPMNLQGSITGNTKVVPDTGTTLLPHRMLLNTITDLHATSSVMRQHFQQRTRTEILKRLSTYNRIP